MQSTQKQNGEDEEDDREEEEEKENGEEKHNNGPSLSRHLYQLLHQQRPSYPYQHRWNSSVPEEWDEKNEVEGSQF